LSHQESQQRGSKIHDHKNIKHKVGMRSWQLKNILPADQTESLNKKGSIQAACYNESKIKKPAFAGFSV
jgi:hypothetical protein